MGFKLSLLPFPFLAAGGIVYANKDKLGLSGFNKNRKVVEALKAELVPITVDKINSEGGAESNLAEIIKEIGASTEQLFRKPIEKTIQVASASDSSKAEDKTVLFYYSNEATRVSNSDSWTSSKAKVTTSDSKVYEVTIYKVDFPDDKNKKKICRFHYKEVASSEQKEFTTSDITDCKGWIGLRDKSEVEKAKV